MQQIKNADKAENCELKNINKMLYAVKITNSCCPFELALRQVDHKRIAKWFYAQIIIFGHLQILAAHPPNNKKKQNNNNK